MHAVFRHFQNKAVTYSEKSSRWPWAMVRNFETQAVKDLLDDVSGHRVLELGCGSGFYCRKLLEWGAPHVFAVDIAPNMVAQLPQLNVTGIVADASMVDIEQKFSRILIAGLLEFVSDPGPVLETARRHATDDATFVVLTPGRNILSFLYSFYHRRHGIAVQRFHPKDLGRLYADTGWSLKQRKLIWPFSTVDRLQPGQ